MSPPHHSRSAEVIPLWDLPLDYERAPRFVPPIDPTTIERVYDECGRHFVDEDEGVYDFMRETRASVRRTALFLLIAILSIAAVVLVRSFA